MKLIEGLCYTRPPYPELVASHPVMREVWTRCASSHDESGAVMAPLLVDDRPLIGALCEQTTDDLLLTTVGRKYDSFRWFIPPISERKLQLRHGTVHCPSLYFHYHIQVMRCLENSRLKNMVWTKIHPIYFQKVHSETLTKMWEFIEHINEVSVSMDRDTISPEHEFLVGAWEDANSFLSHFSHQWVGNDGRVICTRPVWKGGEVVHELIS